MTTTIEQYRQSLATTGLLCESELDSLLDRVPLEQRPQTSEALSEFLVDKHRLTEYQAGRILEGKSNELVLGKYIVQDLIRRGAMGEVYRAKHPQMQREVALKLILNKLSDDPECLARFHREVHLAARLNHPNIVTAYDASESDGRLFLVMEYIDGKDLKTIINQNGALSVEAAVDYIAQAARGLRYAHGRGVIHRDVKPSNLMLCKSGTVKLLDVGLAMEETNRKDSDLTLAGGLLGSVNYMAPEQARDARDADARSDIYSLGCTLWYLLSGSFVYEEKTVVNRILAHRERPVPDLEMLGEDIPAQLQHIFQQMVAKHPDDRYQSMSDLLEDLEKLQLALSSGTIQPADTSCDPTCTGAVHDTDHIRVSSDTQAIILPDEPSEDCTPDDPTQVTSETPVPGLLRRSSQLQTALIVIGGFGLGCLAMLVLHLAERDRLPSLRGWTIGGSNWFKTDDDPGPKTVAGAAIPFDVAGSSSGPKTTTGKGSQNDVPEIIRDKDGRPVPADTPFSPEQARLYQQHWADRLDLKVETTNSLGMKMILIPPGTYQMGSDEQDLSKLVGMFPDDIGTVSRQFKNEFPQHTVTLTKPYYISAHVITVAQFQRFVNESGYQLQPETLDYWEQADSGLTTGPQAGDLPIRYICWNDAAAFCRWISETDGRQYRLPTEAEWEYACRAGSQDLFGDEFETIRKYEWWKGNAGRPFPVGSKKANPFGLYDTRGNIREYCLDYYSRFSFQPQTDPLVNTTDIGKDQRVVRGGGASSELFEIRPARRCRVPSSDMVVTYIGFRVVSPVPLPEEAAVQTANFR